PPSSKHYASTSLSPKRHQFLGTSRMDRHATIKVSLRRAHLDRDTKALQHLRRALANDMQSDDALVGPRADELVARGTLLVRVHHGVVHRHKARLVHLEILAPVLGLRLGLCEPNRANLGVPEDDARDHVVVELEG